MVIKSDLVTRSHAVAGGPGRTVEDFLIWVYADEMALSAMSGVGVFTGYTPHLAASQYEQRLSGLRPVAPLVHDGAARAHDVLQAGLSRADFSLLVSHAQMRRRPDTMQGRGPRVARVKVTSFDRKGMPEAPWVAATGEAVPVLHDQARKIVRRAGKDYLRPVGRKRMIGHLIPWTGERQDVVVAARQRYRTWLAALDRARLVLSAAGIETFPSEAPMLHTEWWER